MTSSSSNLSNHRKVKTNLLSLTSFHSKDNRTIAEKLGISKPEDLCVDRFQVDRRKLYNMQKCSVESTNEAEKYFDGIMKTTETYIHWPRQQNTRTKKDPYIAVYGKTDDVNWAKGLILTVLKTKGALLRLKLAMSHTDHSFIAGNGGRLANDIITDTDTYIQFPDITPEIMLKRNHQVSIYGCLEDVKRALVLLRTSVPIIMSFELPNGQRMPSFLRIEKEFNVKVILCPNLKSNTSVIQIQGTLGKVDQLKQATKNLINLVYGKCSAEALIGLQVDIPPPYHETVKGQESANVIKIMENTKTKVFFPDLSAKGNKKQNIRVNITGTIDGVHKARHELMGFLPIELTFDISSEKQNNATEVMRIGNKFGVLLTLSQKEWSNATAVTVKASENMIDKIYGFQHAIVQLSSIISKQDEIPKAFYLLEGAYERVMSTLVTNYVESIVERTEPLFNAEEQHELILTGSSVQDAEEIYSSYNQQYQYQNTYFPYSGYIKDNLHQSSDRTETMAHTQQQLDINNWIYQGVDNLNINQSFDDLYAVQPEDSLQKEETMAAQLEKERNLKACADQHYESESEQFFDFGISEAEAAFIFSQSSLKGPSKITEKFRSEHVDCNNVIDGNIEINCSRNYGVK